MFSGSEDGLLKIWDVRAGSCQKDFSVDASITDAILHPNQVCYIAQAAYILMYFRGKSLQSMKLVISVYMI